MSLLLFKIRSVLIQGTVDTMALHYHTKGVLLDLSTSIVLFIYNIIVINMVMVI